jgi:nucleotide-binding universal stress UspA family protein/CheY-like chemotaxis protein
MMKILVGYNGGEVCRSALLLAVDYAKQKNAFVHIITSMEGGAAEKPSDIAKAERGLYFVEKLMKNTGLEYETQQTVRGLSPGEDLVKFAEENDIDHIFLGIKKTSRAQKTIMGSTSRYIILKAPCPVTTIRFDLKKITTEDLLKDRRILVVDDEPDILETVEELLDICSVDTAANFEDAQEKLKTNIYDVAILDIMGVKGYDILKITSQKNIPTIMLTAHAITPDNLKKSIEQGASSYIPKDELSNLITHVTDTIKAHIQGGQGYAKWFSRLKPFFDKSFGKGWRDKDRTFWNAFDDKK